MSSTTSPVLTPQEHADPSRDSAFASPNLYQLAGSGIHVTFRTQGFRAPFFTYQDDQRSLSFSGEQVRLVHVPDLGTVVSVTLMLTVDSGSTTFSLVLPRVNLPTQLRASEPVHTIAVITVHQISIAPQFDLGQRDFYKPVFLTGAASLATVPL
jgi:hypothetical protein